MELCEEKLKEYLTVLGYREEVQDSLIKFAREINKLIIYLKMMKIIILSYIKISLRIKQKAK